MHVREFIEKYYPEYYSIEHYPADKCAPFCKTDNKWGIFSNFAHTPVVVCGVTFDTTERLFQVMKFADKESRRLLHELTSKMRKGTVKMQAKHLEKVGAVRPDWGKIIVDAMKFCITEKYRQSETFRQELERSRGLYIVEDQSTSKTKSPNTWGAKLSSDGSEFVGPNLMGRLLMELRDKGSLEWTLPEDAMRFDDLM